MKSKKLILFIVCLISTIMGRLDGADLPLGFFEGTYRVVGVHPDSQEPYQGICTIKKRGETLEMRREISAQKIVATCLLESAAGGDSTVLRARFATGGSDFEITYVIVADLDNYARLSGNYYRKDGSSKERGLETLFYVVRSESEQGDDAN